ncbi:MAG: four-helix bundle copper-binding protein [Methylococcales bacterium]
MNHTAHSHTETHTDSAMPDCIAACNHCHQVCLQTAMNHCLEAGGKHVQADHFRLMLNCAELCQTSANFQLSSSDFHRRVCEVCAEVCAACAGDCEAIGGMAECVEACKKCAESCLAMASKLH